MIPRNPVALHNKTASWQQELAKAVKTVDELFALLHLPAELASKTALGNALFPLRVPHDFVRRMKPGDISDPLLRQVLPLNEEALTHPDFLADPVGDLLAQKTPGYIHKYHHRALLITTGACAVHCRYCFRREFPYRDNSANQDHWQHAIATLRNDHAITEIILSGGDPLTLSDEKLAALAAQLNAIPHLKTLRIHTRLPVVLPSRVSDELLSWLSCLRLKPVMVIHSNHPNEIDPIVGAQLLRLRNAGITVLNQSVLLKTINDDADSLIQLSERLFDYGVMPYYLHLLDKVSGSTHFDLPQTEAVAIIDTMRASLPGYLVPRLVRELAGRPSKTVIA